MRVWCSFLVCLCVCVCVSQPLWRKEVRRLERASKNPPQYEGPGGMVAATAANPLGRASMSKPVAAVLARESAAVVPIRRDSTGAVTMSNDPNRAVQLARRSQILKAQQDAGRKSEEIKQAP